MVHLLSFREPEIYPCINIENRIALPLWDGRRQSVSHIFSVCRFSLAIRTTDWPSSVEQALWSNVIQYSATRQLNSRKMIGLKRIFFLRSKGCAASSACCWRQELSQEGPWQCRQAFSKPSASEMSRNSNYGMSLVINYNRPHIHHRKLHEQGQESRRQLEFPVRGIIACPSSRADVKL